MRGLASAPLQIDQDVYKRQDPPPSTWPTTSTASIRVPSLSLIHISTLAVELAYALQMGLTAASLTRLLACTALAGLLAHYCSLLLRQTVIPRRQAPREPEGLRERLKLSADALRSLCETFSGGSAPKKERCV